MNQDLSFGLPERRRRGKGLIGGLILIGLGVIFLLQQSGIFVSQNWWALFILIPAVGNLGTALALYQRAGHVTKAVRASLATAVIILAVALVFLLDLSWAVYWPIFVILPGLSLLFTGTPFGRDSAPGMFTGPWLTWTGLGATLLGLGFLLQNLGFWYPAEVFPRWWAVPILMPAIGGLLAGLQLYRQGESARAAAAASLGAALIVAMVAVVALLDLHWNLLWPVALIAAGVVVLLGVMSGRRT